jgi:hypothetical protein
MQLFFIRVKFKKLFADFQKFFLQKFFKNVLEKAKMGNRARFPRSRL